jgi:hypothetical protein
LVFTVDPKGTTASPAILEQPTSVVADEGSNVELEVVATGGSLFYQWRKDGVDVPGANAAKLPLVAVMRDDAGSYDVVVTNAAGSAASDPATVTVRPHADAGAAEPGGPGSDAGQGDVPSDPTGMSTGTPSSGGCACDTALAPRSASGLSWALAVLTVVGALSRRQARAQGSRAA